MTVPRVHRSRSGFAPFALGLAVALSAGGVSAPPDAEACGGTLCNGGGPFNQVTVDQSRERVFFGLSTDDNGETLLTAVIQIAYEGYADDFAWILPVPEVPENIDVAEATFFDQLDAATAPSFQFPFVFNPTAMGCSVFGCAAGLENAFIPGAPDEGGGSPVNVWGSGAVGPYEMVVISADTVDPLVEWIWRHGYNAPDEFITIADDYVKENYKFVVVRLAPEAGTDQLAPLVLQYHEETPCVPLRLTSIAAVPDMGVRVWFAGDSRAVPLNYGTVAPDYTKLAVSPNGINDYESLVAGEVETAGGRAWVTEFAAPIENAINNPSTFTAITDPTLLEYLSGHTYITRLYTKISPWEMTEDPFFQFDPNGVDVDNLHIVTVDATVGARAGGGFGAAFLGDVVLLGALAAMFAVRRLRRRGA